MGKQIWLEVQFSIVENCQEWNKKSRKYEIMLCSTTKKIYSFFNIWKKKGWFKERGDQCSSFGRVKNGATEINDFIRYFGKLCKLQLFKFRCSLNGKKSQTFNNASLVSLSLSFASILYCSSPKQPCNDVALLWADFPFPPAFINGSPLRRI